MEEGTIDPEDLELIQFVETADEAMDAIKVFYRE
jgi:predicted Rossmann-fold nucleotide-binding protein